MIKGLKLIIREVKLKVKIWKKIFVYSILLFILLFNGAAIIIIENIYNRSLNVVITTGLNEYEGIKNSLYLNSDLIENYDMERVKSLLREFVYDSVSSIKNIEIFNEENMPVLNISNKVYSDEDRAEVLGAGLDEAIFIIRRVEGSKLLFISSRVRINNLEYKIVLTKDISYVAEERLENYKLFLLLTTVVTVLLAAGMYIISKLITNPIQALTEASNSIKKGDYSKRVRYKSKDEIGVLSENFNSMMQVIEEKIEELEESSNEKQRFIDNLTHEMKTPITSIMGYSDLLQKGNINEDIKQKALGYIYTQAKRLENLSSTLVKLILIKNNEGDKHKFLIKEAVLISVRDLNYKLESKEIKVVTNIEDGFIVCDKQFLQVLFSNIIDNAVKASQVGKKITITGNKLENSNYKLKITDEGIGISEENLKKVKEPFYMVDKSRGLSKNNLGLGLAICSEICVRNNIDFEIESKENIGTTITLTFRGDDKDEK